MFEIEPQPRTMWPGMDCRMNFIKLLQPQIRSIMGYLPVAIVNDAQASKASTRVLRAISRNEGWLGDIHLSN